MRVLLIGGGGQLGTDLREALQRRNIEMFAPSHSELDVSVPDQMRSAFEHYSPEVVINTSAFHKVEECETSPQRAFEVNASAAKGLAERCEKIGATFIHYSTDYVFGADSDRSTPYQETDPIGPVNAYGVSKAAGEEMIGYVGSRYYILRVSGLYGHAGSSGKGGNFVENMLRRAQSGGPLRVVSDQVLTPTSTQVVAQKTLELLDSGAFGLYHMTCEGECSWFDFTQKVLELAGVEADLTPVKTEAFPSPVKRPNYSVLGKKKLLSLHIGMPPWENALADYVHTRSTKV